MSALDRFFNPRSVALIGAAHSEHKLGGVVLKNLLKFKGKVYPVNPKYRRVMGLRSYRSVGEVPERFDLAIILRPAAEVPGILKEAAGLTECALIMSSGFAEVHEEGLQNEVKRLGAELGYRILGPNCIGVYNPFCKLDTLFLPHERLARPGRGNIAIVSQSGAILSCLMSAVRAARRGISKAVGYGNAADLSESEILEYLSSDSETDVVAAYIESVLDGRKFVESAKRLSSAKSLVLLKGGKESSGGEAAFSHTGRLSGNYNVFRSIMMQFGIQETEDLDGLLCAMNALSSYYPRDGGRVCIITNGGGSGVLASDECARQGLDAGPIRREERELLRKAFPDFFGINNPVDLTAQGTDRDYAIALDILKYDYDGFVVIALPNVLGITERLASVLKKARMAQSKPIVAHIAPSGISPKLITEIEKAGIPVYASPEGAVRGLRAVLKGRTGVTRPASV